MTIDLVPEDKPSLKGNVIDLAPGPENYEVVGEDVGIVHKNAQIHFVNVTDGDGNSVEIVEI